jgi:hypothetical protein
MRCSDTPSSAYAFRALHFLNLYFMLGFIFRVLVVVLLFADVCLCSRVSSLGRCRTAVAAPAPCPTCKPAFRSSAASWKRPRNGA